MQSFYKSLMFKKAVPASSDAHQSNLLRLMQASRDQLVNLKSDIDWTVWHENRAPAGTR